MAIKKNAIPDTIKNNVTVETVHIDTIKPYWRNAKTGANVDLLADSIAKHGYTSFIVVDKNMTIIAGHSRYKALKRLGWENIQVNVVDIGEKEAKELRLLDNKIAEKNEWDMDILNIEMREVSSELTKIAFDLNFDHDFVKDGMQNADVTTQQIADEKANLENLVANKSASEKRSVICPHCFEEFYIEK